MRKLILLLILGAVGGGLSSYLPGAAIYLQAGFVLLIGTVTLIEGRKIWHNAIKVVNFYVPPGL